MKYNTKQVKKNFLKERLMLILVILILTLTMVPCITSCIHGNNPEKPNPAKPEVGPENGEESDPPKPTEETTEQKITRILGSFAIEKSGAIPIVTDSMSPEELEKQYAPLGLAYEKNDDSGKVYLLAKNDYYGSEIPNTAAFIKDLATLKAKIGKATYNPYSEKPEAVISFPATIGNVLEWRWKNLVNIGSDSFATDKWLRFYCGMSHEGPPGKPYSMYTFMMIGFYFAVKTGDNPEVYFYDDSGIARYIDWEITFVDRNNRSKGYSFHVGPYSVKVQGVDDTTGELVDFPPIDDGGLFGKYDKPVTHMLKLSTLIRISLEKKLTDAGISADVANQKVNSYISENGLVSFDNWDVYLTPYRIHEGPNKISKISKRGDRVYHVYGIWRNTFKLNHLDAEGTEFWDRCWKQP
mgnify:CR=1 FL=1